MCGGIYKGISFVGVFFVGVTHCGCGLCRTKYAGDNFVRTSGVIKDFAQTQSKTLT